MLNKIINWLLYDKPIFQKEIKLNHDKPIPKSKWKKNWLGLTKVYDSYDTQYNWCFIKITSHLEDDDCIEDYRNTLSIGFGPYYKKYLLPFSIIKPILDYHHYIKDENGKDTDNIKWSVYTERVYEISIVKEEGYFSFDWNIGRNFLYNITKHKGFHFWYWFFWKKCTRSKKELLNLDGSLFKDITDVRDSDILDSYELIKKYEEMQPTIYFNVLDYDKELIEVKSRLERNTYSYGNGKFTVWLMKFFKKPEVYINLDLEFNKEVGTRKGSWKGGTIGHSVEVKNITKDSDVFEELVKAFKQYCITPQLRGSKNDYSTNMTYLGYRAEKDIGITKCVPYISEVINPFTYALIDIDKTFIKNNNDFSDYDLPIKFQLSKFKNSLISNENIKYYVLEDEKIISTFLYKTYLYKTLLENREVNSNCLNYIFTQEAIDIILKQDNYLFKYINFIDINAYENNIL